MAVPSFIQVVPAGNGGTNTLYAATLGANANSGVQVAGNDNIIRISASLPITVRFGPSATLSAATATDIYIPANSPEIFDLGHINNAFSIFAFQASTVVTVNVVSKN
jgi:hypothetical protein